MKLKLYISAIVSMTCFVITIKAQNFGFASSGSLQKNILETSSWTNPIINNQILNANNIINSIKNSETNSVVATYHLGVDFACNTPNFDKLYYFNNSIPTGTINRKPNKRRLQVGQWFDNFMAEDKVPKYRIDLLSIKNTAGSNLKFLVRGTGIDSINNPITLSLIIIEDSLIIDSRTFHNVVRAVLSDTLNRKVADRVVPNKSHILSFEYNITNGLKANNLRFVVVASKWDSLSNDNRDVVNCVELKNNNVFVDSTFTLNFDSQCVNSNQFIFKDENSLIKNFYNCKWIFSNNPNDTASGSVVSKSYQTAGSYSVKLVRNFYNGYTDTVTKQIVVMPKPQAGSIFGPVNNLQAFTPYLYNVNQQLGLKYNWVVNNGGIVNGQGTNAITIQWLNNSIGSLKCFVTNDYCIDSTSLLLNIGTRINNEVQHSKVLLSPNPVNNFLTIDFKNNLQSSDLIIVQIFDMFGRLVYDDELRNSDNILSIPMDNYSPGNYIITVKSGTTIAHHKIIKN